MAFGIQDLERDVQKFRQDIENAKVKYLDEYTEYVNIATDLENIGQKYDFLQEEVETIAKVFPEERDNTLLNVTIGFISSLVAVEVIAGISYAVKQFTAWKLTKVMAQIAGLQAEGRIILQAGGSADEVARVARSLDLARASQTAKISRQAMAARIAGFSIAVGGILGIVTTAVSITLLVKQKEYLEQRKGELKEYLDDINSYIAEANDETKNVIDVFSTYFDEFAIDVDGVFNEDRDGFLDKSGARKFEDAVSQLREILNGSIKRMGELNAATKIGDRRVGRYLSQGYKGQELIGEVVLDTELPEEVTQRLYVFKLRKLGSTVKETIELSRLPEDLVKKLYARGYLGDGKTVEETVLLSRLTEERVRRVYASKLLDDRLNTENQDDFLSIEGIAEQAGISEDIVLEIQRRKITDLPSDSEEKVLEPELVAR